MSSLYDTLRLQAQPYETRIKTLLNSDLKTICKEEGLPVSGVKAVLQGRVIERLNDAVESGDSPRLQEIIRRISRFGTSSNASVSPLHNHNQNHNHNHHSHHSNTASAPSQYAAWAPTPLNAGYPSPGINSPFAPPPSSSSHISTMFRPSPFYTIKEQVSQIIAMPMMTSSRYTSQATFRLSQGLPSDHSLRVMVYCSVDYEQSPRNITFPNQVEVKVNDMMFQGNLRGIKKKPGTTKPADITGFVDRAPGKTNRVSLAYAATDRRYSFVVCTVKKASVEQLVERIKKGHSITKQAVINEMVSKAKDPDIVATSTVMSLKCPLSATRMALPCRSTVCNHNQCFDATSFLQLQEQAPQWTCPICSKSFGFEALVVDQFVQDILTSVSKDTEQITIEPNGSWKQNTQADDDFRKPSSAAKRKAAPDALELDGSSPIEQQATDSRLNGIRAESVSTPQSFTTPTFSLSREASASASTNAPRSAGSKRPAEEVIDLTLSDDDEDDEEDKGPRRPAKRLFTGNRNGNIDDNNSGSRMHPSMQSYLTNQAYQNAHDLQDQQNRQTNENPFMNQRYQHASSPSHTQNHRPVTISIPPRPPSVPQYFGSPGFNNGQGGYGAWQ